MQVFAQVSDPSAWLGSELARDRSWIHQLTAADVEELDRALRGVIVRGLRLESVRRSDFPLPALGPKLVSMLDELRSGRGFFVLRGFPLNRYSEDDTSRIYWGIGTHLGTAVKQNPAGDLLGHVRDLGKKWGEFGVRGYETNGQLLFHTDFSDVVGLLCLSQAHSGGLSRIASATTVHNELARRYPEHLAVLYRGFRYIKREAVDSENPATNHIPVFAQRDGVLSCRLVRERIEAAAKRLQEPLTRAETEALDALAEIAASDQVCLAMELRLGDMQFLNNYTIFHSRTAYADGERPGERRHLLRLWLTMHGERRTLAPNFPQANGYGIPGSAPPTGAVELGLANP
jgi:hypothetical protein